MALVSWPLAPTTQLESLPYPINQLPYDVFQIIFTYAEARACLCIAQVSRTFSILVCNKNLWLLFCRSLGYPATEILFRKDIHYCFDYLKLRNFNVNFQRNQFVVEIKNDAHSIPIKSSYDLCCVDKGTDCIEIYNVWSKKIELSITPELSLLPLLTEIIAHAKEGVSFFNDNKLLSSQDLTSFKHIVGCLIEKGQQLERFIDFSPLIRRLKKVGTSADRTLFQRIEKWCRYLSKCLNQKQEIIQFEANPLYCIVHFKNGFVNIWDRRTKSIATSFCDLGKKSFGFMNQHVCVNLQENSNLIIIDPATQKLHIMDEVELFQVINDSEILVICRNTFLIRNFTTCLQQRILSTDKSIIDFNYDAEHGTLAVVSQLKDLIYLTFYNLHKHNGKYKISEIDHIRLSSFTRMEWRNKELTIFSHFFIMKVSLHPDRFIIYTLWLDKKAFSYVWEGEKLSIHQRHNNQLVTFNYFVTFEQVAQDLIKGYRSNLEEYLLTIRFEGFFDYQKEGIYAQLPLIDHALEDTSSCWEKVSRKTKAQAIERYLNSSTIRFQKIPHFS